MSVQIAARDRLSLLKEAVESALEQDTSALEILVIDDGSGPSTQSWLEEQVKRDSRLRVVRQPASGVACARHKGLLSTAADLVCILDSDDRLVPGAVSHLKDLFEADATLDLIYTNNVHESPDGSQKRSNYPRFHSNAAMLRATFLRPIVPFKHSGTMFRREVALDLGGYDTTLPMKVDVDLFLRFLQADRSIRLVEDPMVIFRIYAESMSHSRRMAGIPVWARLIDHYAQDEPYWRRSAFKGIRTAAELAKVAYTALGRVSSTAGANAQGPPG